jgi:uncharacterized protein
MSFTLYDASIPALQLALTNLSGILDKAAAHAESKNIETRVIASTRLVIDMFPLAKQVQIACDVAKGAAARLSGVEAPKFEDNEATIEELKARIAKTQEFIASVPADAIATADAKAIEIVYPSMTLRFTGRNYVTQFVLPNLYFHVTTAYAILRANGVNVGKGDYLGAIQ